MTLPTYASREDVKASQDIKSTSLEDSQIDRALQSAGVAIDGLTHRSFLPLKTTYLFDWPYDRLGNPLVLYLDDRSLISLDSMQVDGTSMALNTDFFLYPDSGPPYTRVELSRDASRSFTFGQRKIRITGLFGFWNQDSEVALTTAEVNSSAAELTVTDGSMLGVGDLIRIGTERMTITGRRLTDSGQTLGAALEGKASAVVVPVSDGTGFAPREVILIDGERMLITDIAGNNLLVRRAWDGTALAAHDIGADVFVSRTYRVSRAVLGTTAETHSPGADVFKFHFPPLVRQLAIAEAIDKILQEQAGYARTSGSGENERETRAVALRALREDVYTAYGRKVRMRSV